MIVVASVLAGVLCVVIVASLLCALTADSWYSTAMWLLAANAAAVPLWVLTNWAKTG